MSYKKLALFLLFILPIMLLSLPGCGSSSKVTVSQNQSQDSTGESDITLATNAGQTYLVDTSKNDSDFAVWKDAIVAHPEPYYNLDGKIVAYMFAVNKGDTVMGHVLVGSSLWDYAILEAGSSPPPAILSANSAKKIIETDLHLTVEEKNLAEPSRLVYLGYTAIFAVYDVEDKSIAINLELGHAVLVKDLKSTPKPIGSHWTTYTVADGLARNITYPAWDPYVIATFQDIDGNIWFGTNGGGVSRYDGKNWQTFTSQNGLADNQVGAICQDRRRDLWFGCVHGVARYDGQKWRIFTIEDGLPYNSAQAIMMDSNGNLWFATPRGVSRYDGTNWRTFTTVDGLAADYCNGITQDKQGNLWFATQSVGVSRYDGEHFQTFTTKDGLVNDDVKYILQDTQGNLWFATIDGASRYDGQTLQSFTFRDDVGSPLRDYMHTICQDNDGNIWIGTSSGALRYDGTNWQTITTEDGLLDNLVMDIYKDSQGNLWFGTQRGVSRYKP